MEMKQMYFDYKLMVDQNLMKRLNFFINNLEEKLSSVKIIHDKLYELMSMVSKTHETILEELITIKTVLNQPIVEQEEDEIIPIDATKSEWDDDDDDDDDEDVELKKFNKNISERNNLVLNSPPSKSISSSTRSKSVSFNLDENIQNQQQLSKQTKNEIITPIKPLLSIDTLKQNQDEIKPNIDKTLTNIRIHEIESKNGNYLRLLNISNSDDYDLSGHFLQQNIHSKPICRFRFPPNTIIQAGQTVTIWCGHLNGIIPQPPHIFVWKEQKKWETGPECITILAKPNGQSIAWFRNLHRINIDDSSSDILFVHSKSNAGSSDISSNSSNSINPARFNTRQSRPSAFNLSRNNKPPFAHSPSSPIHPDHNGTNMSVFHDFRSQMHQKNGFTQLLNRPKSSPFASHTGCKQDIISMNYLRPQKQKQTIVKT